MNIEKIIEQASIEDAKEILDLQKLSYRSEAAIYDDYTIPPLIQTLEEIQADINKQIFLKALANGKIVGSVRAYTRQKICLIGRLIVHPRHQNQGLGARLMDEIEKTFSRVESYELFTGHLSERNIHFYKKRGYKTFNSERITKDLTLIFMRKIKER